MRVCRIFRKQKRKKKGKNGEEKLQRRNQRVSKFQKRFINNFLPSNLLVYAFQITSF